MTYKKYMTWRWYASRRDGAYQTYLDSKQRVDVYESRNSKKRNVHLLSYINHILLIRKNNMLYTSTDSQTFEYSSTQVALFLHKSEVSSRQM